MQIDQIINHIYMYCVYSALDLFSSSMYLGRIEPGDDLVIVEKSCILKTTKFVTLIDFW